jgi:CRP-like cAMP-binding protein
VWLQSGHVAYEQGVLADVLFIVISGRMRLMHKGKPRPGVENGLHIEEEVGRGETIGAVWAVTGGVHDTTAIAVRDSELVRMSRSSFEVCSAVSLFCNLKSPCFVVMV